MSSVIYYRFRSSKNPHRFSFDGTGVTIFELKRGILLAQRLDSTADTFQLVLTNPDTNETYSDDSEILPRSSIVEARRLPVFRQGGHDSASQYVSGSLALNMKNASRREDLKAGSTTNLGDSQSGAMNGEVFGGSEQDMMNVMFAQQGAQWSRTQQEMATKQKIYAPKSVKLPTEPDKTLPPGYICHRCGQKGHWINNCPSLYDPNWETKKVLRTTGIPKSMLRTVQREPNSQEPEDGRTYLMNADGEYVVAVADDKSWQAFQDKQLQQQARNQRQIPAELQDPITQTLLKDPRRMPCCKRVYSYDSIETALIQTDFKCPNCGQTDIFIDQLEVDKEIAAQVARFGDAKVEENGSQIKDSAGDDRMVDDSDDSDYSPFEDSFARKRKRRDSNASVASVASVASAASHKSEDSNGSAASVSTGTDEPNSPPDTKHNGSVRPDIKSNIVPTNGFFSPMMMPFMFNPFMMPALNGQPEDKEDSDYDPADDQPVKGRIR